MSLKLPRICGAIAVWKYRPHHINLTTALELLKKIKSLIARCRLMEEMQKIVECICRFSQKIGLLDHLLDGDAHVYFGISGRGSFSGRQGTGFGTIFIPFSDCDFKTLASHGGMNP